MAKRKAHEQQLARARAKRIDARLRRRRRATSAIVGVLVVLLVIGVGVSLVPALSDDPAPVIDEPTEAAEPVAGGVACGGEVPPGAGEEKPTFDAPPELALEEGVDYRATLATSCGEVVVDLLEDDAPRTVNNFVFLAREGFYDGLTFHRVVPGFVVQGGDPAGDGTGGPGYEFEDELALAEEQGYEPGTVAMANAGPDTSGSQFFVVLPGGGGNLAPDFSIFGRVVEGMEAVEQIGGLPTSGDAPLQTVYIERVTIGEGSAP